MRRVSTRQWTEILDRAEQHADAPGVTITGGALDLSIHTAVKGAGRIGVHGDIDLLQTRFQPWREVNGVSWPLGVFIPTAPDSGWSGRGRNRDVTIKDKLSLLARARIPAGYSMAEGDVVTTIIQGLIEYATGQPAVIDPLPHTLRTAITPDPGEIVLGIINDLCAAINAFSIWCDGWGRFQVQTYVEPARRPIVAEFIHGENATFLSGFTESQDLDSIPNHTIATTEGTDEIPGLVAEAFNDDPDDPLSTVHRGIVSAEPEQIEATSQAILDAYALRRLIEQGTAARTVTFEHIPADLPLNAAIRFEHPPAGLAGRFVVQKTAPPIDEVGTQTTTVREVVG